MKRAASEKNGGAKKRKICDEHRFFQDKWTNEYLFVKTKDDKSLCLVCMQVVSTLKEYNLKRHYEIHAPVYDKYTDEARSVLVTSLKK